MRMKDYDMANRNMQKSQKKKQNNHIQGVEKKNNKRAKSLTKQVQQGKKSGQGTAAKVDSDDQRKQGKIIMMIN